MSQLPSFLLRLLLTSPTNPSPALLRRSSQVSKIFLSSSSSSYGRRTPHAAASAFSLKKLIFATSCIGRFSHNKCSNNFKKTIVVPFCSHGEEHRSCESVVSRRILSRKNLRGPSCLQHWFKNLQNLRKNKLTASTFAMAVGFSHNRRIQLWLEKLGTIEPTLGCNLSTFWTKVKEEEALRQYKLLTGNTVSFPESQAYGSASDDNWLAATPDVSPVYNLSSRGVLEIKCPLFNEGPWRRIPLYYIPQAQGLMEILDRDWMDLYVWTMNGTSLFRLHRDREYWGVLKIALSDFWWKHVQPAKEECKKSVITNPRVQLKSLLPAPKHQLCSYIVHESKRVVDNSGLLMREIRSKFQN